MFLNHGTYNIVLSKLWYDIVICGQFSFEQKRLQLCSSRQVCHCVAIKEYTYKARMLPHHHLPKSCRPSLHMWFLGGNLAMWHNAVPSPSAGCAFFVCLSQRWEALMNWFSLKQGRWRAHSTHGQVTVPRLCTKDSLLHVYLTMYLKSLQSRDRFFFPIPDNHYPCK